MTLSISTILLSPPPLSHHVITKLGILYHLPTCHRLSSLGEAKKKKKKQIKKVAVAFFLFKAKQKGNLLFSFWAKPKKKQVRKKLLFFLEQKGNVFFISSHSKKGQNKQTFFSSLQNALLKISHRLSSKKNGKSSPPTQLSSLASEIEHVQTTHPPNHDDVILKWSLRIRKIGGFT